MYVLQPSEAKNEMSREKKDKEKKIKQNKSKCSY